MTDAAPSRRTSKRGLRIGIVVAGLAMVLAAVWSAARRSAIDPEDERPARAEVRAYFGDLADGATNDRFTIVRVFDVRAGAIPVVLATRGGQRYQVDVLRRDDRGPLGVATTNYVAFYVANAGDGDAATPEEQTLAVRALADDLRWREAAGAKPPALATMAERMAMPGARRFAVPLK